MLDLFHCFLIPDLLFHFYYIPSKTGYRHATQIEEKINQNIAKWTYIRLIQHSLFSLISKTNEKDSMGTGHDMERLENKWENQNIPKNLLPDGLN